MTLTPRLALLLTLPPLLSAGNAVGRLVRDDIPPMALNALRWLLAFVLIAAGIIVSSH